MTWKPNSKPTYGITRLVSNRQRKYGVGMPALEFTVPTGTVGKRARQRTCPPAAPYVSAKSVRRIAFLADRKLAQRARRATA